MRTIPGKPYNFLMVEIIFKDENLLAVSKPAGLLTIRGRGKAASEPFLAAKAGELAGGKVFTVHRLDRDVSGVVLFARNPVEHRRLNRLFETRKVKKSYLVLVRGRIDADRGKIDLPVREYGSGRMGVGAGGKLSQTEFTVLERFADYTLAEASPLTGRRHQIRVHFYAIGHPVAGDTLYGDPALQRLCPRLMLHSLRMAFPLSDGTMLTVTAAPPAGFTRVLESLRGE